jgi:T-complex protein 11
MLMKDTVRFETEYFRRRIGEGRLETENPRKWYNNAVVEYGESSKDPKVPFLNALVHMLIPSVESTEIPVTFMFDVDRLELLRTDIRDVTCLQVCSTIFHKILAIMKCKKDVTGPVLEEFTGKVSVHLDEHNLETRWQAVPHIAVQIVKSAHQFANGPSARSVLDPTLVRLATGLLRDWTDLHNNVYKLVEKRVIEQIKESIFESSRIPSIKPAQKLAATASPNASNNFQQTEIKAIAQRLAHIARLHWDVFDVLVYRSKPSSSS